MSDDKTVVNDSSSGSPGDLGLGSGSNSSSNGTLRLLGAAASDGPQPFPSGKPTTSTSTSIDTHELDGQIERFKDTIVAGDLSEPLLGGTNSRSPSISSTITPLSNILHNAPQKVTWNDLVWDLVFVAMCKTFSAFINEEDMKEWNFNAFPDRSKFAR